MPGVRLAGMSLLVLIPLLAGTGLAAAEEEDRVGIRLVDAPVASRADPRAQVYVVDHVRAGTTIHRTVEVGNDGSQPLDVELYPGPAEVRDGAFRPEEGAADHGAAGWITVSPTSVHVAPGERARATVEIAVPSDATTGEHYAVVWAQPPAADGGGVRVVNRVGVRVYLSVGDGEPPTDFVIENMGAARSPEGVPSVRAEVHNTGGRAIDLAGELVLEDGPGGSTAGPFPARLGTTIEPGARAPVAIDLPGDLPDGPWQATLTLQSGTVERTAAAAITFPAPGVDAEPVPATPVTPLQQRGIVGPVAAALILIMLAAMATLLRRRRGDMGAAPAHG